MFTVQVRQAAAAESSRLAAAVDAAVAQLAAHPELAARDLAEAPVLAAAEPMLLQRLPRADQAQTRAIVQLLTEFGTPRSAPALGQIAHQELLRPAALAAIERLAGFAGLAEVAQRTDNRVLRRAIAERLLAASSAPAVRTFLSLASQPPLRSDALAAAESLSTPPTTELLALLQDDDKQMRLAAAMTLGRINGPQVTAALIAIVTDERAASTEAWLALLACRGESAEQFLASASQHPRMLGHVNNARLTLSRMLQ
jgi:hypothetical protein